MTFVTKKYIMIIMKTTTSPIIVPEKCVPHFILIDDRTYFTLVYKKEKPRYEVDK